MEYRRKLSDKAYMDMAIKEIVRRDIEFDKVSQISGVRGSYNCKKVRCLETGLIYKSAKEASLMLGLRSAAVCCSISKGMKCGGYRWEYVGA